MEIDVEVLYALPEQQWSLDLRLSAGTTAEEAEKIAREREPMCWVDKWNVVAYGVWGEVVDTDYVLQDGDRLELLRPLVEQPMDARRRKAKETR